MTLPTTADFNNAKRDLDDLSEIVTSPLIKDVPNRAGGKTPTIRKVMDRLSYRAPIRNRGAWSSGVDYDLNDIWQASDGVWYIAAETYVAGDTESLDINSGKVFSYHVSISTETVETIADLRLYEPKKPGQHINLSGHTVGGIGGDSWFHDVSDTDSQDDNGNIIVTVAGNRWKRKDPFPVDPANFGALPDGSDSTAAILAAVTASDDRGIVFTHPHSFNGKITGCAPWIQRDGAKLTYTGPVTSDAVIEIGIEGTTTNTKTCVFDLSRASIDWSNADHTGLRLVNFANCNIHYREIFGFTVGIQELGFNNGFAYNTITVGILISNKTQIQWAVKGSVSPWGYHNENVYSGGRFTNFSFSPTGVQRIGVHSFSIDGVYLNNNNNVWLKPSFELFDDGLPVLMEAGTQNEFLHFRNESNGPVFAEERGQASENLYIEGYSDQFEVKGKLLSSSTHRDSVFIPSRTKIKSFASPFFSSGSIRDLCNYYSYSRVNTRRVQLFEGAAGVTTPVSLISNFTLHDDSLGLASVNKGVGISIDVRNCQRIAVKPNCSTAGGRINIVCYDSAKNQIAAVDGQNVYTMKGRVLYAEGIFFGGYRGGIDLGGGQDEWYQFSFGDNVHFIDLIFSAGSAQLNMKSFDLYSFPVDDESSPIPFLKTCKDDFNLGTAKPAQGIHKLHDRVDHANPAVGQPQGWLCVSAGDFSATPPVYVSLPALTT
jgi:hypothetical protein